MQEKLYGFLKAQDVEIFENYPLSEMSSVGIGGTALVLRPKSLRGLVATVSALSEWGIEYKTLGRASNVLPPDDGYGKAVVCTTAIRDFRREGDILIAECGASFRRIALELSPLGFGGYEELVGIPGSVGGMVAMNAGAYGRCVADFIEWAEVYLPQERKSVRVDAAELDLSYRDSAVGRSRWILLSAAFRLQRSSTDRINRRLKELSSLRRASQPLEYPSLGSVFKRTSVGSAAKMIDECGLKGLRCGGAQVSEKHAGFIVNRGNATAAQYISLMEQCREAVLKKFGVSLEPEIEIL